MANVSETGIDQIPRASHAHVWVLTAFLSLVIFLVAWRTHLFSPHSFFSLTSLVFSSAGDTFTPFLIGLSVAAIFRVSVTRKAMLRESLLQSMDLDELSGGPWSATDHLGNQIRSLRAPLRFEPPYVQQPPDLFHIDSPEVQSWIKQHQEPLSKASPYELQALAWCAFQGTPASVTDSHGGASLFSHTSKVWLAAAQSFGFGSDPALLAVSHDLGKVLAYARSGDQWTLSTSSHEHLSVVVSTRLSALLSLDEPVRRRLINHLISYSLRKNQKATDPDTVFSIRSVIRADSSVSAKESAKNSPNDQSKSASVEPFPEPSEKELENRRILAESGLMDMDGEACIIPIHGDQSETQDFSSDTTLSDMMDLDISDYQTLSDHISTAITHLNINGAKRNSGVAQGLYCEDTGFFVRVFDLIRQLKSEGVAVDVTPEESLLSPWATTAGNLVLTVMTRTGWIITSPGRFSSEDGDRGVFNLKSGSKRYNGMVSINQEMLPSEYVSSLSEWCFDVDAVR